MDLLPGFVEKIVMAALTLHNLLQKSKASNPLYCPPGYTDTYDAIIPGEWRREGTTLLDSQPRNAGQNSTMKAKELRDEYAGYFMKERQVSWQWEK